jgi:hypothetical protein
VKRLSLLLLAVLLAACASKSASISGDVFLLMQNGDVKRGAGNTVLLLGPADSVLATRGRVCTAYGEQLLDAARHGGNPADEASASQMVARLDTSLVHLTVASSKTGINAHYRIDHVPAGQYILWAETMIGDNAYTWWAPVVVAGGDSVSRDLDNSTEAHAALYCGHVRDSLATALAKVRDSVAAVLAHVQDSVANFARIHPRQGWLRCMIQARASLKRADGVVEGDIVERQRECWRKFPVDPAWANSQNP